MIFEDKDLSELDTKGMHWYHSHVGYVQQDPYGALPPFMNVQRILEEPLIVGGVKNKEERLQRVRKSMEEVKLTPVDDFLLQVSPHAERRAAAACGDRPGHDHGAQIPGGR